MLHKITFHIILIFIILSIISKCFAQSKVYTNKDIENLKQSTIKIAPPKKTETPKQYNKIKNLPIEKKEIKSSEPFVKYDRLNGKMNLTVVGAPKKVIKQANDEEFIYSLRIKEFILPYSNWNDEYEEYFDVHYGDPDLTLSDPSIIAIRSLKSSGFDNVFELYKRGTLYDEGDDGLMYNHLSSHFVIDSNGAIFQTMPLNRKTKGAFGVEHKAITIELTGLTYKDFDTNSVQKKALLSLLEVLIKKFKIDASNIYSVLEISQGKTIVKEYLDLGDSEYPDRYSPKKSNFGPSADYMKEIRKNLVKGN